MSAVLKEQQGDVDAFVEHHAKLMRYLNRRLPHRDKQLAEDLVQEIGIRYWRRVTEPDEPLAYLYGIASHVLADFITERNYRQQFEISDMGDAIEITVDIAARDVADDIDGENHVARLLAPVPCVHRAVLILHKMYGYSYEDVARELGLSEFTVEKYLTQAKFQIRSKRR